MRFFIFGSLLTLFAFRSSAQDYPGYQNSNHNGVNAVFFNPAAIAANGYKWDANIFSVNVAMANKKASFNLSSVGDAFKNDQFSRQFLARGAGTSTGIANATITGPSVMFSLDDKSALAITTRGRVMMNARGIDGELLNALVNEEEPESNFPYGIMPGNDMRASFNAWSEYGLSYARVLKQDGPHLLKAGATIKYLSGSANGYLNINGFNGTLDHEPVSGRYQLRNASGRMEVGFAGAGLSDFKVKELGSFRNTGIGADIGIVYEFQPHEDDASTAYLFKIGLSLLDAGSVRYHGDPSRSAGYDIDITDPESLDLRDISNTNIDGLRAYFDAHPEYFIKSGSAGSDYSVSLPASFRIDADYHVQGNVYVSIDGRFSLVDGKKKFYNSQYYSTYSLTPRYEGRNIGIYAPLQYNKIAGVNAGLCFRFGPVFLGSGSFFNAAFGESRKADLFLGVRFGRRSE